MRLKKLCGEDKDLYEAMENFLLLDPKSQVKEIGEAAIYVAQGNAARISGDRLLARVDYEIAARIEISRNNKESAGKCLTLADEVSEPGIIHERHQKMLRDMDRVMEVAESYYGPNHGIVEPATSSSQKLEPLLTVAGRYGKSG